MCQASCYNGMLFCWKVPLPPGASPRASEEILTHRPSQALDCSPISPGTQPITWRRGALQTRGSTAIGPQLSSRARPLAAGGVHVKRGLGWRPEEGEVAGKLKGAARRRVAGVWGSGQQGGGERDALAHGRMRLPAEGADLSPGPRCCCGPRCPCCPRCPRAHAAAGWCLCTSCLMSCTRYVLPKSCSPSARPQKGRRGARSEDPVWFLPSTLSSCNFSFTSGGTR